MINLLLSILAFGVSVFLLAVTIRFGLRNIGKLDAYFSQKNNSTYAGFQWHYRIPFDIGIIPEYFFALVIAYDNYFKRNWWPLKTAAFLSLFLFFAGLNNYTTVMSYFSFQLIREGGFTALFTSGSLVLFLDLIMVLYLALFTLLSIESIRMHGIYAPVRIAAYSLLSFFMAQLSLITISLILFFTFLYIVFKIIKFLFFSSRRRRRNEEEEESAGNILNKGMKEFKVELLQWEEEGVTEDETTTYAHNTNSSKKERPKITRRKRKPKEEEDIPRLHPD